MRAFPRFTFLLVLLLPSAASAADLRGLLRHTLVLGASVSRGFATEGPGSRLAKRFGGRVTNLAEDSKPITDYEEDFDEEFLAPYSAVIAIDVLFWDSGAVFFNGAAKEKFSELVEAAAERGIPLVVGDIPKLVNFQLSRGALNAHIRATCRPERRCYVLPFDQLHRQAVEEGILIKGRLYSFDELVEDGLHMNATGSEYVAGMIASLLR